MPHDCLVWGEAQAASGLTGLLGKGPGTYTTSADTITVKGAARGDPYLFMLGSTSDTKAGGCALLPELSNRASLIYGPGAIAFAEQGLADFRLDGVKMLANGETLTGQVDNANTNEGSVVAAWVSYGGVPAIRSDYSDPRNMYKEKCTITSAAAVTSQSGKVTLDSALTSTSWLNTKAKYEIRGVSGCVGAATFGGICQVDNLGGPWAGYVPGIPINGLSAVTFSPGMGTYLLPEPIPFDGDALPSVSMMATSAGAIVFTMHIAEVG